MLTRRPLCTYIISTPITATYSWNVIPRRLVLSRWSIRGAGLEPLEEQLDLPALPVDRADHAGGDGGRVGEVAQQPDRLRLAAAVDRQDRDPAEPPPARRPTPAQLDDLVGGHARLGVRRRQRQGLEHRHGRRVAADAQHEVV